MDKFLEPELSFLDVEFEEILTQSGGEEGEGGTATLPDGWEIEEDDDDDSIWP